MAKSKEISSVLVVKNAPKPISPVKITMDGCEIEFGGHSKNTTLAR
jgi:hypothetical protein